MLVEKGKGKVKMWSSAGRERSSEQLLCYIPTN